MRPRRALLVLALLAACRGERVDRARQGDKPPSLRDEFPGTGEIARHLTALAGPETLGRGAGTDDERRAAEYVAAELGRLGLTPLGDDGFFQRFTLQDGRPSQNVVGALPGTDPDLAAYIVVGAHLDHLGVIGADVYYGADDNASGVAGMLALAQAFAKGRVHLRRTIVFVAFGGEEIGLQGSAHFTRAPPRPLADLALMVNLDMIGRTPFLDAKLYATAKALMGIAETTGVGVIATAGRDDLIVFARAACTVEELPMYAPGDFPLFEQRIRRETEWRGDQASFAAAGAAWIWFSTSMHDDYHLPSDTVDKASPEVVRRVALAVFRTLASFDRA